MNIEELPLLEPIVIITSFPAWKKEYTGYRFSRQLQRLESLEKTVQEDPIAYIVSLSKKEHLSDAIIAQQLGTPWTPKMIFTLRKLCGITGNDHRQANADALENRPKQTSKVQSIVAVYLKKIHNLEGIQSDPSTSLDTMVISIGFQNLDMFFVTMLEHDFGERPTKQIIDALCDKYGIPTGKGNRVGRVYIQSKLRARRVI